MDVYGGGPGGGVKVRVCGSHRRGPVVAGLGAAAGVADPQRRAPAAGPGRRRRMDSGVVRGPGDFLQSNDPVLVAPSETVLRADEFCGRLQGSSPRVREGAVGSVVGREGGCGDRTLERGVGVGEEPCSGRGTDRVSGEAESVHPRLPAAAKGRAMDREHAGGEVQRLGSVSTMQASGNELVAPRGVGLGRVGSRTVQRRA